MLVRFSFSITHALSVEVLLSEIPKENYIIKKPVFFGAALKDAICAPEMGKIHHEQLCPKTTTAEINESHWILNSAPDRCNQELLKWIKTLG